MVVRNPERLVSQYQVERELHISHRRIAQAMDDYASSRGARGLRYVVLPGGRRRLLRWSSVMAWLDSLEEAVCR